VPSCRSDGQVFPTRPKGVFVNVELRMLTFSVVLGIVQIKAASTLRACSAATSGRRALGTSR
jgi:hypothetical protein